MLLRPKTFKKYQEADETHDASRETNSTPLCNIGLNLRVSGKGTLAVEKDENIETTDRNFKTYW